MPEESLPVLRSKPCPKGDKHSPHPKKESETLIGVRDGKESLVLWNQDKNFISRLFLESFEH